MPQQEESQTEAKPQFSHSEMCHVSTVIVVIALSGYNWRDNYLMNTMNEKTTEQLKIWCIFRFIFTILR